MFYAQIFLGSESGLRSKLPSTYQDKLRCHVLLSYGIGSCFRKQRYQHSTFVHTRMSTSSTSCLNPLMKNATV